MPTALEALCDFFDCPPSMLARLLKEPENRLEATNLLAQKILYRDYGRAGALLCNGITQSAAAEIPAFNGFMRITVPQYLFSNYGYRLRFPYLPCIIQNGNNSHRDYFPLEAIRFKE